MKDDVRGKVAPLFFRHIPLRLLLAILLFFVICSQLPAADDFVGPPLPQLSPAARIDLLMNGAIQKGLIAGGVVLVGGQGQTHLARGYGRVSPAADARAMTVDTIFDLASLTKVVATTPSVLKLAEEGRLSLTDPIRKWLPEFSGKGKDDLLVLHLLTHTSAIDDFPLDPAAPLSSAVQRAADQPLKGELGSRFHYADINFILLGEIVRRASGIPLNAYAAQRFYQPLGLRDTTFLQLAVKRNRTAATIGDDQQLFLGEPQDHLARQLGGVAGHAGLFSTAEDLAVFCRMLLGGGSYDGRRIIEERTVSQMTAPYFSRGGRVIRGLGWDIASPFSSPRGSFFSRESFGHTGYSGTSIWIDPGADLFVILLTTRLEYRKKSEFNQLRSELSTLAVEAFGSPPSLKELEDSGN